MTIFTNFKKELFLMKTMCFAHDYMDVEDRATLDAVAEMGKSSAYAIHDLM